MSDERDGASATGEAVVKLTGKEVVDAEASFEGLRMTKLGHAIDFMNNHLAMIGSRHQKTESWQCPGDSPDLLLDLCPESIRSKVVLAMEKAAEFAAETFAERDD